MSLPLLQTFPDASDATSRSRSLLAVFASLAFLAGLAGVLFSSTFWLVNFDVATRGAVGPLHGFLGRFVPAELYALLEDLSRDRSTVTPLVVLLLMLALVRGSALVLFRPKRVPRALASSRGHFPFAAGYQTTWVQLGLIGTLWSFLLIGGELGEGLQDPAASVLVLVESFNTALLSTLSGILGAFIVGPLVALAFRNRLMAADIREESSTSLFEQLERQLGELTRRARETSSSFGPSPTAEGLEGSPSLTESALGTSRALGELEGRIDQLDVQGSVGQLVDELVERLTRAHHEALGRVQEAVDRRHADTVEALVQGLEQLGEGITSGQEELGKGLREGLSELAEAQRREREAGREALTGRLTKLEGRLRGDHRRLTEAVEERPLELIREVEKEGREAVLRSIAEARTALEGGIRNLSSSVRTQRRTRGGDPPGRNLWSFLRGLWRRS